METSRFSFVSQCTFYSIKIANILNCPWLYFVHVESLSSPFVFYVFLYIHRWIVHERKGWVTDYIQCICPFYRSLLFFYVQIFAVSKLWIIQSQPSRIEKKVVDFFLSNKIILIIREMIEGIDKNKFYVDGQAVNY